MKAKEYTIEVLNLNKNKEVELLKQLLWYKAAVGWNIIDLKPKYLYKRKRRGIIISIMNNGSVNFINNKVNNHEITQKEANDIFELSDEIYNVVNSIVNGTTHINYDKNHPLYYVDPKEVLGWYKMKRNIYN